MATACNRLRGIAWFPLWATGTLLAAAAGCTERQPEGIPTDASVASAFAPASSDPDLQAFLVQFEAATKDMLGGDSTRWKELVSHADDSSLLPPFGGVSRGWEEIRPRYEAAAARLTGGEAGLEIEILASGVSGDLAYVVAFERSRFRLAGSDADQAGFTRVTHILRREQGQWRLLHRHMDHLPESFTPPAH